MTENLRVTKLNDGTTIPVVNDATDWNYLTSPALSDNFHSHLYKMYGNYYNGYVVETRKICPEGWHIPSKRDWKILANYLAENGYNYDGSVSRSSDSDEDKRSKIAKSMANPNTNGGYYDWFESSEVGAIGVNRHEEQQNLSNFTALSSGNSWWSSSKGTIYEESSYSYYSLYYNSSKLIFNEYNRNINEKKCIRCVKD